jgi:hypothetical protein
VNDANYKETTFKENKSDVALIVLNDGGSLTLAVLKRTPPLQSRPSNSISQLGSATNQSKFQVVSNWVAIVIFLILLSLLIFNLEFDWENLTPIKCYGPLQYFNLLPLPRS